MQDLSSGGGGGGASFQRVAPDQLRAADPVDISRTLHTKVKKLNKLINENESDAASKALLLSEDERRRLCVSACGQLAVLHAGSIHDFLFFFKLLSLAVLAANKILSVSFPFGASHMELRASHLGHLVSTSLFNYSEAGSSR